MSVRPVEKKTSLLTRVSSRGNMRSIEKSPRTLSVSGIQAINPDPTVGSDSPSGTPRKPPKPGKPQKPSKPSSSSSFSSSNSPSKTSSSSSFSSLPSASSFSSSPVPNTPPSERASGSEIRPPLSNRLSFRPKSNNVNTGATGFLAFAEEEPKSEKPATTGATGFLAFADEEPKKSNNASTGAAGFMAFADDEQKKSEPEEPAPEKQRPVNRYSQPPGALPSQNLSSQNLSSQSISFEDSPSTREEKRAKKDKGNFSRVFKKERKGTMTAAMAMMESKMESRRDSTNPPPPSPEVAEPIEDEPDCKYSVDDGRRVIRAASVSRLVAELTQDEVADPQFRDSFLITYRAFVSPIDLLEHLIVRYSPSNMSKQGPLTKRRVRVAGMVKAWLEQFYYDFNDDAMQNMLNSFVDSMSLTLPTTSEGLKKISLKLLKAEKEKREKEEEKKEEEVKDIDVLENIPEALRGEVDNLHTGGWLDLKEEELAQQMTKVESQIFTSILPKEYLAWNKKNRDVLAPNISHMIKHFNELSNWVRTQMVILPRKEARIKMLQKFIRLMEELYKLNNFNGMMEILSGINSSPVRRMKKTFEGIGKQYTKRFQVIENLLTHNHSYRNYRKHLHSIIPPCIPYLGVCLTDLTFVLDGNPDYVDGDDGKELVHFFKWRKVSEIVVELKDYQIAQYTLVSSPPISLFLRSLPLHTLEENPCYDWSTKVEPKNQKSHNKTLLKLIQNEEELIEKLRELKRRERELVGEMELLKSSPCLCVCLWEYVGGEGKGVVVDAGDILESISNINPEWGLFKTKNGEKVYVPRSFVRRLYPRKQLVDAFFEKEKRDREEKERKEKEERERVEREEKERKEREKREKEERRKERERKRKEKEEKKREKELEKERLEREENERKERELEERLKQQEELEASFVRSPPLSSSPDVTNPPMFSSANVSRSTSSLPHQPHLDPSCPSPCTSSTESSPPGLTSSSSSTIRFPTPPLSRTPSPLEDFSPGPSARSPSALHSSSSPSPTQSPSGSPSTVLKMNSQGSQKNIVKMNSQKNIKPLRKTSQPHTGLVGQNPRTSSNPNMAPLKRHTSLMMSSPPSPSSPLSPKQDHDESPKLVQHLQQQQPPPRPARKPPTPTREEVEEEQQQLQQLQEQQPQTPTQQKPPAMRLKLDMRKQGSSGRILSPTTRNTSTPRGMSSSYSPGSPGGEERKSSGRMTIMKKT